MKTETTAAGGTFSATVRLELEAAKMQIVKMVHERVEDEMGHVIGQAMEEALAPENFRRMVCGYVKQETARAIENAVKNAVTYNHEVQACLEREVKHVARDVLVNRFGRD